MVETSPQNPRHAAVVERLNNLRAGGWRSRRVRPQLPLAVSEESLSEPDIALVAVADHARTHPTMAWLVVEVADASLRKDRRVKAEVYARADILEYWIVDRQPG